MTTAQMVFDDGANYERFMGAWSQLAGNEFLDWLKAERGRRWLDVGCGNGAFTELVAARCAPSELVGIDPAEPQLRYARTRASCRGARFEQGSALSLPFGTDTFDVAVMPLVLFFVPDPPAGVAEMVRVVRPGGIVSAYSWDLAGDRYPYAELHAELQDMGFPAPLPPKADSSSLDQLQKLWTDAGLRDVATTVITVQRTYSDFHDYWQMAHGAPSTGRPLAAMSAAEKDRLQARMRARLKAPERDAFTCSGTAHAVKGVVQ